MINFPKNKRTERLLETYRPRIYVAPNSYRPVSFYKDYLPRTDLYSNTGKVVEHEPDKALLKEIHRIPWYHLDLNISPDDALSLTSESIDPTLYGRVYGDTLVVGDKSIGLLFLKYSPVFMYSGLPSGTNRFKYYGSYILGNPVAWHEGDIHGATYVILHRSSHKPLGILLAQHNHHRVYWREKDFQWPSSNRVRISYAEFSNEPYLISNEENVFYERTVGNPRDLKTLHGRNDGFNLKVGFDRIVPPKAGARRINYQIKQLSAEDPLYRALIPLGDRYNIGGIFPSWYREGPPGMDYYAPPWMKNFADLTSFWNIDSNDDQFFQRYDSNPLSLDTEPTELMDYQRGKTINQMRRVIPD